MIGTNHRGKVPIIDDGPGARDLLSETLSGVGGFETVIARIRAVADSHDAMTSNRPYRQLQARSHGFAIGELNRCTGTRFGPEVARVFLETPIGGEIRT
jgi:hypothetical protein